MQQNVRINTGHRNKYNFKQRVVEIETNILLQIAFDSLQVTIILKSKNRTGTSDPVLSRYKKKLVNFFHKLLTKLSPKWIIKTRFVKFFKVRLKILCISKSIFFYIVYKLLRKHALIKTRLYFRNTLNT